MMSRSTGRSITLIDHIEQSIQDILTTPIGSRIMRRGYGSLLPKLIDSPLNPAILMQVKAAAATAILQWEERIQINHLSVNQISSGKLIFDLQFNYSNKSSLHNLQIPLNFGGIA